MATPVSGNTAYASAADFEVLVDFRRVADLCLDDGTRATQSSLASDANVAAALASASGLIEAAVLRGGMYTLDTTQNDLAVLTGNSLAFLKKLVCDLAFGILYTRRNPLVEELPANYRMALQFLDDISAGSMLFGILENQLAGRSSHHVETEAEYMGRATVPTLARRRYGKRGSRYNQDNR